MTALTFAVAALWFAFSARLFAVGSPWFAVAAVSVAAGWLLLALARYLRRGERS